MFCRAWFGGIAAGSGWQRINASLPPGPLAGRCLHRPGNPAMPQTPCGGRDRPPGSLAEVRKDIGRARHRTAPLSRLTPPAPLTGEPSGWQALYKASPARGCGVERRLRRRKRDGAGAAVAEHKRASARAVRCGHRKPDGGCAARRRRRGALPLCAGDILQSPAEPCPASVGDDACIVPETLQRRKPHAAGENARPTLRPGAVATHKRQPSARPVGGTMLASSRKPCDIANPMRRARSPALHCGRKRAATYKRQPSARPLLSGAALHDRHPPAMPAAPGLASRRIRAAAGPACAAGEGMV